ncbi:MAG: hypothetical protein RL508_352 [Actinomycetota bacterium]|jgi:predicted dehydrogenase
MTQKLRWAMVGTGFMADLIVPDFKFVENAQLVAMVTRSAVGIEAKMEKWGVNVDVIESLEEAIANPDIDLIYIASPHSEHFRQAKQAIEGGKHVLVEKAMTMDAAEARELKRLAEQHGVFLMEEMWSKYNPLLLEVKRRVDAGDIGQLRFIETDFGFNAPYNAEHRLFKAALGGGSALDQGVYTTTIATLFAGSEITKVEAKGHLFPDGADASCLITLTYANGVIANAYSTLNMMLGMGGRVVGTAGRIEIEDPIFNPDTATVVKYENPMEPTREKIHIAKVGTGYTHMITAVSQAVLDGKLGTDVHPMDATIRIMEVLDEARAQINAAAVAS